MIEEQKRELFNVVRIISKCGDDPLFAPSAHVFLCESGVEFLPPKFLDEWVFVSILVFLPGISPILDP